MSRAFVKEGDGDEADTLPERPLPPHANYVTARGLAQLQQRVREIVGVCEALRRDVADDPGAKPRLRAAERDLRYFSAQLERAELVSAAGDQDAARIRFGATVRFVDNSGREKAVRIVGDYEADAAKGDISWVSPLARALIGACAGDVVTWRRPAGVAEIEILHVDYR